MTIEDIPPSSQSNFPSRSYERTRRVPQVMSSVRCSFCQMYGVAQLLFSSRSTRQSWRPVFASKAAAKDFSSLSFTTKTRPAWTTGDPAEPQSLRVLTGGQLVDQ